MKRITLMRHGRPTLVAGPWISPAGMSRWIEAYDRSEAEAQPVPAGSMACVGTARVIVASTANRSISSIRTMGANPGITSGTFNEAPLPSFARWGFPRLPPPVWMVLFRVLWFLGCSRGAESAKAARQRAQAAAAELVLLAQRGPVVLVGHGIMNRLISRELIASGWRSELRHRSGYWSVNSFTLPTRSQAGR